MDKPVVVKVGGALLENATALQNLLGALQTMQQAALSCLCTAVVMVLNS